eukprot:352928-Chlamydomonas_euryale.AAC.1
MSRMLGWALEPASEQMLLLLVEKGKDDARAWAATHGLAGVDGVGGVATTSEGMAAVASDAMVVVAAAAAADGGMAEAAAVAAAAGTGTMAVDGGGPAGAASAPPAGGGWPADNTLAAALGAAARGARRPSWLENPDRQCGV